MYLWSAVGFQVVIGVSLEIVHGWKRVAIIYLASVLGGSLFVSVVNRFSYSHGASGAVYGLIFSHLATLILNWNEVDRKFVRLFCILFYVSQDFIVGIYYELLVPVEMDVRVEVQILVSNFLFNHFPIDESYATSWRRNHWIFSINFTVRRLPKT